MVNLENKIAFVTGSSKGIGKALAHELLKSGSQVIINGRNEECLEYAREELSKTGKPVLALQGDVSDSEVFESIIQEIIARYGRLDILILNAGLSTYGLIDEVENQALQTVMKTNTLGCYSCAHIAVPHLKKTKGSLVFISSLAGLIGMPRTSLYCMSKMALTALAQSLKIELRKTGIHIGIAYVGFTKNDPDKTVIGCDGGPIPIIPRPDWLVQSKEKAVKSILRLIRKRRFKIILTPMGKIMNYIIRHFPRISLLLGGILMKSSEKLTKPED